MVLDIIRTILQTAVAAGVPVRDYLIDILEADPGEISQHPERYTPYAWQQQQKRREAGLAEHAAL